MNTFANNYVSILVIIIIAQQIPGEEKAESDQQSIISHGVF